MGLAGGEGLLSLERAFLFAGARAVPATLWEVGDGSSLALMERFYDELARGAPTGAALAAAKRALLAAGGPPRTWAGFVLVGSPGGRVTGLTVRGRPLPWPALGAGALALLSLLAAWRARTPRMG